MSLWRRGRRLELGRVRSRDLTTGRSDPCNDGQVVVPMGQCLNQQLSLPSTVPRRRADGGCFWAGVDLSGHTVAGSGASKTVIARLSAKRATSRSSTCRLSARPPSTRGLLARGGAVFSLMNGGSGGGHLLAHVADGPGTGERSGDRRRRSGRHLWPVARRRRAHRHHGRHLGVAAEGDALAHPRGCWRATSHTSMPTRTSSAPSEVNTCAGPLAAALRGLATGRTRCPVRRSAIGTTRRPPLRSARVHRTAGWGLRSAPCKCLYLGTEKIQIRLIDESDDVASAGPGMGVALSDVDDRQARARCGTCHP